MKGLCLYGLNCRKEIWEPMQEYVQDMDLTYVEYPHELTSKATSIHELSAWVYAQYSSQSYDVLIGHSMGGILALELVSSYPMKVANIILLDTNVKPANIFYRNIMLEEHLKQYPYVMNMIQEEAVYCNDCLRKSLQEDFDYTSYVKQASCPIHVIYGDRGQPTYPHKIQDLCLDAEILAKLHILFIENCAHMPMIENPKQLMKLIKQCLSTK